MKINFDRDRLEEAKDIRNKWYHGEKIDRLPYIYSVPAEKANPYNYRERCESSKCAVEGAILEMKAQLEGFPDSDYLPHFNLAYLGEGILAEMYGATQYVVDDNPPYTEGRLLKNIYELDKLPKVPDIDSPWGKKLKEHIMLFLNETNGEIPICVPDYQSPYGTATKLMPNEELMYAMYDEPEMVKEFLKIVTDGIDYLLQTIIGWVGTENFVFNDRNPVSGQSGIILWDDYVSVVTPELYKEFCVPENKRLFEKYGRGHLHTCGPYFPGYIDAAVENNPISMDISIMRGMGKTREDMLEFRRITKEHGIKLFGDLTAFTNSIFEEKEAFKPDADFMIKMADGGYLFSGCGTKEDFNSFKAIVKECEKRYL